MDRKVVLYIIIGILVLGILLMTFFPNMIYAFKDSGSSGEDKCSPPPGKTLEEWKEHMGHHPDVYKDCL